MINKKKVGSLLLLTVLMVSLVFVNLNVTSVTAASGTMKFDSGVTMDFETGNCMWIEGDVYLGFTSGVYLCFYNETFDAVTEIAVGAGYYAEWNETEWMYEPENCSWWYIYSPEELLAYGSDELPVEIHVCNVTFDYAEEGWNYSYFNIGEIWCGGESLADTGVTLETPAEWIEAEQKIDTIAPGMEYYAYWNVDEGYPEPEVGSYWYLYWPEEIYGASYAIHINYSEYDVETGFDGEWNYSYIQIDELWDYWYLIQKESYTVEPPMIPFDCVEGELMIDTIAYDETYELYYCAFADYVDYMPPMNDTWWLVTWPASAYGVVFHIDDSGYPYIVEPEVEEYWYVHIDQVYTNISRVEMANITILDGQPIPTDGIEAYQLIETIAPCAEYYISSPACYLPEDVWFNITYPDELTDVQFNVSYSEDYDGYMYFAIDQLNVSGVPVESVTLTTLTDYVEATAAETTVSTIGSWYNIIEGPTPDVPSCWNITAPEALKGVTFLVDMACEGVFRIDEVLDATGQPGPIALETPVENVTAELRIPAIYIEPAPGWYITGENYTVLIKTDYVFHVWGYEFTLTWNPDVLNVVEVTNGDLIVGGTATFVEGTFDNTAGELSLTGAYFDYTTPPAPQTHGPGTMANVTFKVVGCGDSDIILGDETKLIGVTKDGYGTKYNGIDDITGQIRHGFFSNLYNIVVTSVTVSADTVEIGQSVSVNVTVANEGGFNETFNVTVYANVAAIQTKTVTNLASGNQTTLTFSWDTTGVTLGSYNISAYAAPVPGETYTLDNTFIDGTVTIVKPPLANFTYSPEHPAPNQVVTFDASLSTPDGGTIMNYTWNFGDENVNTVTSAVITHVYATHGNYTVTLNVTDSEGLWDTESELITVRGIPVAKFTYSPERPIMNEPVNFNASASMAEGGTIVSYFWNFGDGTNATGMIVGHTYTATGNYTVTLTITDSEGLTDALTDTVTVQAPPPDILLYAAVAAVAIIVIAAIAVYILKFRKPT